MPTGLKSAYTFMNAGRIAATYGGNLTDNCFPKGEWPITSSEWENSKKEDEFPTITHKILAATTGNKNPETSG